MKTAPQKGARVTISQSEPAAAVGWDLRRRAVAAMRAARAIHAAMAAGVRELSGVEVERSTLMWMGRMIQWTYFQNVKAKDWMAAGPDPVLGATRCLTVK